MSDEKLSFKERLSRCSSYNEKVTLIKKKLKKKLVYDRYIHTLNVADTCRFLAMSVGYDGDKAYMAGLLHDCAKCIPDDEKIRLCEKYNLYISDVEKGSPYLLHSKLGAFLAQKKYLINDSDIISAIECHTTGKPDMNILELIVFVADYIEPGRNKASNLKSLRMEAFRDIEHCAYLITQQTLEYLTNNKGPIDNMTQKTYDFYNTKYNGGM